jgi:hypothetical protein
LTNVTVISVEPSPERREAQSAEDEGTSVSGAAVGKAVTVETTVGTDNVAVERVNSAVCVGGKAVTRAGLGLQADSMSPATITKSNNWF